MILLRKISKFNNYLSKLYLSNDHHLKKSKDVLVKPIIPRTDAEHQILFTKQPEMPENPKLLKISILGAPNVGKSTLVNRLINRRVTSVSSKVNTTRSRTTAVLTDNDTQLVILDTPGIVPLHLKKRFKLERSLIIDPRSTLWESDIICVIHDCSDKYRKHKIDPEVLKCLYLHPEKESILILNKVDLIPNKKMLFELIASLTDGQLNGIKYDIENRKLISDEARLEHIFLNTAKKLNLKLVTSNEEKEAIKLIEELKECENVLFNNPDYVNSFDKELDIISKNDPSDKKSVSELKAKDLIQNLEKSRMNLEKFMNKNDPTPYNSINDITAQEFKEDLMKTTDWHLYYEKLSKLDFLIRDRKSWPNYNQVFIVSAKTNDGIDDLKRYLFSRAKPGNWMFTRSLITDQMPKDIALNCVREKFLEHIPEEVPYVLTTEIGYWEIDEADTLRVVINIFSRPKRESRDFSYLLSNGGKLIKLICEEARQEMMNAFQCEVALRLCCIQGKYK